MGRPASSTRLKAHECVWLPMSIIHGLPPASSPIKRVEAEFEGAAWGLPVRLKLQFVRSSRGWRFLCNSCGRNAFKLYFAPESTKPGCRTCLELVYYSQYDYTPPWVWM